MIESKLLKIRNGLKLPKIEFNQTGGFNFRNAEAMLPMIKAALEKEGLTLFFNDTVVNIGVHNYVKTTLTVVDVKTGERASVDAFAREDDIQTLPSSAMVTGASSSYAHKYALQGMFAIDDGKMDPDTWNGQIPAENYTPTEYNTAEPEKPVNSSGVALPIPPAPPVPAAAENTAQAMPNVVPDSTPVQPVVPSAPIPEPPKPVSSQMVSNIPPAPQMPGIGTPVPGYEQNPIVGQAPVMPDFNNMQMDDTPTFPWQQDTGDAPDPLPFLNTQPQAPTPPAPSFPAKKERANVIGVSYDIMQARAKIITANCGIVYYRVFDKNAPSGPWSCDQGTNLDAVDLNQLYSDASAFVRMPLESYTGMIQA